MDKIRLAQKDEIVRQKELWKCCFEDSDNYINFYYTWRYKEGETAVLLHKQKISAMLTMLPVQTVIHDSRSFRTAMIYAVATDPECRKRGFASQLMGFSDRHLAARDTMVSIVVPANAQLFEFYRKRGFQEGFYIRENFLTAASIKCLPAYLTAHCTISSADPAEYNRLRTEQLRGRFFISYSDEDIAYQKKLSQLCGLDIYKADIDGGVHGCLTAEKITEDKVLIKEFLLSEDYINLVLKEIVKFLPAKEYIVRTPAWINENLGGPMRTFGMIKGAEEIASAFRAAKFGYLGLAFD